MHSFKKMLERLLVLIEKVGCVYFIIYDVITVTAIKFYDF